MVKLRPSCICHCFRFKFRRARHRPENWLPSGIEIKGSESTDACVGGLTGCCAFSEIDLTNKDYSRLCSAITDGVSMTYPEFETMPRSHTKHHGSFHYFPWNAASVICMESPLEDHN